MEFNKDFLFLIKQIKAAIYEIENRIIIDKNQWFEEITKIGNPVVILIRGKKKERLQE